eukprot:713275_1
MFSALFGTGKSTKQQNKPKKKKKKKSTNSSQPFTNTVNEEQGQKHRVIVTLLLSMTLSREVETELLWFVAQGFDLPLVIGEQFISKTLKFQSASYHACLEFTLTTLFHESFAQQIWLTLISKLHDIEVCQFAMNALERKTRKYRLKQYDNCFIGKEAIDFLIHYKFVHTRERGLTLGETWEAIGLIDHVAKGHGFKDDQLFYRFNEDEIANKMRLIQQSRQRSRDTIHLDVLDEIERVDTGPRMMNLTSNTFSAARKQNNRNKTKRSKKQKPHKSNAKKTKSKQDLMGKDTIFAQPNGFYAGSANTLIDEDSKIMDFVNNEWSDSGKEMADILSDYSDGKLQSVSPNPSKHRKKHSLSLPWFGHGNRTQSTPM